MLETTNGIIDNSVYSKMTPKGLFAWQRVRISSHLSEGGKEWFENF